MVPPASHKVSRVSWYSGSRPVTPPFTYGTFTLCGLGFPAAHSVRLCESLCRSATPHYRSNTVWPLPRSLATTDGISVDFSSCRYLDVSVPCVYLPHTMNSCTDTWAFTSGGLPHSDICGSMAVCASPQLFAACHVLLRLLVPRHSPCALYSLTCVQLALHWNCTLIQFQVSWSFPELLWFSPIQFSAVLITSF